MNCKRFFAAGIVVFVVIEAMEFVINNYLMMASYEALKTIWRPDMMEKMWIFHPVMLLSTLLFVYIFIKGREGKGICEGVRYGLIMWLFVSVPYSLSLYVTLPIPFTLSVKWLAIGFVEMLVAGVLAAAIYKPAAPKAA